MNMIKNLILDGHDLVYLSNKAKKETVRYLMPGVKIILEELSRHYKIFILSDGGATPEEKNYSMKNMGISHLLSGLLCTQYDIGMRKKDSPEAFKIALKKWKLKIEETIFISHDEQETRNAEIAGMKTILINDLRNLNLKNYLMKDNMKE